MGGRRAARRESAAARGGRGRRRHVAPAFGRVATPAAAALARVREPGTMHRCSSECVVYATRDAKS